jgi:hypothetical protein
MNPIIESGRVKDGMFASSSEDGFNGFFRLVICGERVKVIASDGMGWQHVSVSKEDQPNRVPHWGIMCEVKNLFWGEGVWVVQYHPAQGDYVNNHPGCLHLWRPTDAKLPTPPSILTGWKEKSPEQVEKMGASERLRIYAEANRK